MNLPKSKNKLPRKRKKSFKKALGSEQYSVFRIINEIEYEKNGKKASFDKLDVINNQIVRIGKY